MKYFSTFSGIGGFELGIQRAFYNRGAASTSELDKQRSEPNANLSNGNGWGSDTVCVGYSEIDKYAIKVYERNFKHGEDCRLARERERNSGTSGRQETLNSERTCLPQDNRDNDNTKNERSKDCDCIPPTNYGDITKINTDELPDFDCLVGGFPCQAFSIAGKRAGFADTRGTLFFDLARILRAKQPRLFVFENVKGLLNHDNGRTFKTIIEAIEELGYDCQWQVLNSKNHGVPQNRERIIIVGHLRGTPRPQVFPIDGANSKATQKYVGSIGTPRKGLERQTHLSRAHKQPARVYDVSGISPTLSSGETQGRYNIVQLNNPTHSNDRVYGKDGISPTLNTMQGGNRQPFIQDEPKIRRLTPLECERLQAFPDFWTKYGEDEHGVRVVISDTQRYKMCGNAVTTNVIQAVFERIFV